MTYSLPGYDKYKKIDKMLPKAAILSSAATISGQADTSMAESLDANSQLITKG